MRGQAYLLSCVGIMFLHPSTIQPAGMFSLLIISSVLQPWLGIGIEGDAASIGTSSIRHLNQPLSTLGIRLGPPYPVLCWLRHEHFIFSSTGLTDIPAFWKNCSKVKFWRFGFKLRTHTFKVVYIRNKMYNKLERFLLIAIKWWREKISKESASLLLDNCVSPMSALRHSDQSGTAGDG